MDIHKPKPWHGVREFLKEYLIIVVGVLTALGAEQGVEWLHWRHVIAEARHELKLDQMRLISRLGDRQAMSPCLARRLDELSAVLDQAEVTRRLPPIGEIGQPGLVPWNLRSWSSLVSGGVLPHFPRAEAERYSAEALYLATVPARETVEDDSWSALRAMIGPGRPIAEAELISLRGSLMTAYRQARQIRTNANQLAALAHDTGLLSDKEFDEAWRYGLSRPSTYAVCQSITHERGDALAGYRERVAAPPEPPKQSYDDPARRYIFPGAKPAS